MPRSNGKATAAGASGTAVKAGDAIVADDKVAMPSTSKSGAPGALSSSTAPPSSKQNSGDSRLTAHDLGSACSSSSSEGSNGGSNGDKNEENGEDPDALAVARFLRSTPGLSRAVVGDLLGDAAPRVATAVLGAFARSFDWRGVAFEEALRRFLDAFRLPGEAQKIYRVLDAWSVAFFEANCCEKAGGEEEKKGATAAAATTAATTKETTAGTQEKEAASPTTRSFPFASADAVHVLAFSAIMLNTDAHNQRVRLKMTRSQFVLNNRGINGGGDLPEGVLETLYDSIVERPIRGPQQEIGGEEAVEAGSVGGAGGRGGGGSCSGEGGGGGGGDTCCNNNSSNNGSRSGLVLGGGGGSGSFGSFGGFGGGGGAVLARVASAGWSGRAGANNGGSSRGGGGGGGGAASGRAASASGDGATGEAKRLLQLQRQQKKTSRRGLFACFASGDTK